MSCPEPLHEPLEIERLLTKDERRLTVGDHHDWRESLAPRKPLDEIDELVAEIRAAQPEGSYDQ